MDILHDLTQIELDQLNSDGGLEKQQGRFSQFLAESEPLELVCKSCNLTTPARGYMGFVFTECPVCSGELEGVQL